MIKGNVCTEPALWDEIVHDLDGHPLQLWGWGELKAHHNWHAHRILFTDESDGVVGAAQVLVRALPAPFKRLCYVPRGPVWLADFEQPVLDALVAYVKQHLPGVLLSIEPDDEKVDLPKKWRSGPNTILIPHTLILNLHDEESTLLAAMTKKTRQYIHKSEREAITIRQVKERDDIKKLLEIYHQTALRAKFAIHDDSYYYDAETLLGDSSVIFAVYEGTTPLAFVWLAASKKTAFELYGGMSERGQRLRVNYALKWYAIRKCKEWGIDRYDMNGLLNDGISTFKRGFSNHETMLVGTYDYPLSRWYPVWTILLPWAKKIIRAIKRQ